MKTATTLLLIALLLLGSGCFPLTTMVRDHAEGYTREDKQTHKVEDVAGNGVYYALMPLTIPTDIVAQPIYVITFCVWIAAGMPGFKHI